MKTTNHEIISDIELQEGMVKIPYDLLKRELLPIPLIIDIKRRNKSIKWRPTKKFLNYFNAQLNPRYGVIAVEYYTVDTPEEEKESEMLIKKNAKIAKEPMSKDLMRCMSGTIRETQKIGKMLEKYKPEKFYVYEKTPWKKMLEV